MKRTVALLVLALAVSTVGCSNSTAAIKRKRATKLTTWTTQNVDKIVDLKINLDDALNGNGDTGDVCDDAKSVFEASNVAEISEVPDVALDDRFHSAINRLEADVEGCDSYYRDHTNIREDSAAMMSAYRAIYVSGHSK